jgi:hypothetical protein
MVHEVLSSPGRPLDAATRAFMEPRFGRDFSHVRVHTDAKAAESARAVNASAYTVGNHIVSPGLNWDLSVNPSLIAHELTHVVQQDGAPAGPLSIAPADHASEREADAAASAVLRGASPVATAGNAKLARQAAQPNFTPNPPVPRGTPPPLQLVEREAARKVAQQEARIVVRESARRGVGPALRAGFRRLFWKKFWQAVIVRFGLRGAIAAALSAADGPLPIGEIISLGLALWTAYEIVQLWDTLSQQAEQEAIREMEQAEPEEQPQTGPAPHPQLEPRREERRDQDCFRQHPTFIPCDGFLDRDEAVVDFLVNEGRSWQTRFDCRGFASFPPGVISACDGAPGERFHCTLDSGEVVSVFGCFCCDENGGTGMVYRGAHWSIPMGRTP